MRRKGNPQVAASSSTRKGRGFSLVEVAVALGITAVGVLAVVALLPIALGSLSDSSDRNAYARIRQSVAARYAMIDWNVLEEWARNGHSEVLHFDFQGSQVAAASLEHAYSVQVQVDQRRMLAGDDDDNRYLRTLEVRVTGTPERTDALTNPVYYDVLTVSLASESKLKTKYRD